jgi:hypothetical protein
MPSQRVSVLRSCRTGSPSACPAWREASVSAEQATKRACDPSTAESVSPWRGTQVPGAAGSAAGWCPCTRVHEGVRFPTACISTKRRKATPSHSPSLSWIVCLTSAEISIFSGSVEPKGPADRDEQRAAHSGSASGPGTACTHCSTHSMPGAPLGTTGIPWGPHGARPVGFSLSRSCSQRRHGAICFIVSLSGLSN